MEPIDGRPSFVLWHKLRRLQKVLYKMNTNLLMDRQSIIQARDELTKAQEDLIAERLCMDKIDNVKKCTEKLIKWNDIKESILNQNAKIKWLKAGDGDNSYFHASARAK